MRPRLAVAAVATAVAAAAPFVTSPAGATPYAGMHRVGTATVLIRGSDRVHYRLSFTLDAAEQASSAAFTTLTIGIDRCNSHDAACRPLASYTKQLGATEYGGGQDLNVTDVVTTFGGKPFGVMWYAAPGYGSLEQRVPSTPDADVRTSESAHFTLLMDTLRCTTGNAVIAEETSARVDGYSTPTGTWPAKRIAALFHNGQRQPSCHSE
jgi:hypothetical protein